MASNITFGDGLVQMFFNKDDDLILLDHSRGEIIIIQGCILAKKVLNKRFYVLKVVGALSVALASMSTSDVYVLSRDNDMYSVKRIRFHFPTANKTSGNCFEFENKVVSKIQLSGMENIQSVCGICF